MILGLDISTSKIGYCIFDRDTLLEVDFIDLRKEKDYYKKLNIFKEKIINIKLNYNITKVIIEDPLGSSNNINTAMLLAKFNGVCSYITSDVFNVQPIHVSVHQIRKTLCKEFITIKNGKEVLSFPKDIDKKMYIWEKVNKLFPDISWYYGKNNKLRDESFDMSDSIAVVLSQIQK